MVDSTSKPHYLNREFDAFLKRLMDEWHVPGISMAVIEGENIYAQGYGTNGPGGPAITEDTMFDIASMTKSATAAAVASLVDDDKYPKVNWNTPVSSLIREDFVLGDPYYTENVTITDILCHRSGVAQHEDITRGQNSKTPSTSKSITRSLRYLPLAKPFRAAYQYSNANYSVAAHLVESLTGNQFADVLKKQFWEPLGMHRTCLGLAMAQEVTASDDNTNCKISRGFYWNTEKQSFTQASELYCLELQGGTGLMSSANDWARWIRAWINGTVGLSESSLREMTIPRILARHYDKYMKSSDFYGLGWHIQYYRGYKVVMHAGEAPGQLSLQIWLPAKQWGMVLLGISENAHFVNQIVAWTLIQEILDVPQAEKVDWARTTRGEFDYWAQEAVKNKDKGLFPNRPDPPLPMQLPLSAYTGCYEHPAYGKVVVEIENDELRVHQSEISFGYALTFEHVSGDFFIIERVPEPRTWGGPERRECEFEVGHDGKVKRMGLDFMNGGHSQYLWFVRVDEE